MLAFVIDQNQRRALCAVSLYRLANPVQTNKISTLDSTNLFINAIRQCNCRSFINHLQTIDISNFCCIEKSASLCVGEMARNLNNEILKQNSNYSNEINKIIYRNHAIRHFHIHINIVMFGDQFEFDNNHRQDLFGCKYACFIQIRYLNSETNMNRIETLQQTFKPTPSFGNCTTSHGTHARSACTMGSLNFRPIRCLMDVTVLDNLVNIFCLAATPATRERSSK